MKSSASASWPASRTRSGFYASRTGWHRSSLSFARDRSNSLFSPSRGYILRFDAEYAASSTLSEFGYARLAAEWTTYREPLRGLVLATRVRPGWARALDNAGLGVHPSKRFFAGVPTVCAASGRTGSDHSC